jgi:hypothetical protein
MSEIPHWGVLETVHGGKGIGVGKRVCGSRSIRVGQCWDEGQGVVGTGQQVGFVVDGGWIAGRVKLRGTDFGRFVVPKGRPGFQTTGASPDPKDGILKGSVVKTHVLVVVVQGCEGAFVDPLDVGIGVDVLGHPIRICFKSDVWVSACGSHSSLQGIVVGLDCLLKLTASASEVWGNNTILDNSGPWLGQDNTVQHLSKVEYAEGFLHRLMSSIAAGGVPEKACGGCKIED